MRSIFQFWLKFKPFNRGKRYEGDEEEVDINDYQIKLESKSLESICGEALNQGHFSHQRFDKGHKPNLMLMLKNGKLV